MNRQSLRLLVMVVLGVCAGTATIASAKDIVIRNGSFENPLLSDGTSGSAPDDWDMSSGAGHSNEPDSGFTIDPNAVDGEMITWMDGNGNWMAQELQYDDGSTVLSAEGLSLELTFYVGRQKQTHQPYADYAPVVEVILECFDGSSWQTFASSTYNYPVADYNQWHQVSTTLTMTNLPGSYLGKEVLLSFLNQADTGSDPSDNSQALIDLVVAVPEPATLTLLALGGLAVLRRKKQ